jgi:hypothetical protein
MSADGLLPPLFSRIDPVRKTPVPASTWLPPVAWLLLALVVFFGYARRHAVTANPSAIESGCSSPSQLSESGTRASVPAASTTRPPRVAKSAPQLAPSTQETP